MSAELSAAVGFAVAALATFAAVPVAIAVARRADFYDRPRGYRKHGVPTPLLGGAAALIGVLAGAVAVGGTRGRLLVLIVCAVVLWLVGTIDDRMAVAPRWRLLAETMAAVALFAVGLGWSTNAGGIVDAVLTVVWIVGLVNAFNLMDNLDGACSTVGCVAAAGVGVLATIHARPALAGLAFAVAGGCAVFLRWNLASPARIFLGDGGSMTIGFIVAALTMATARDLRGGNADLFVGALIVGLPILDTALVSVSRKRRGVTLVTGGRDHLTHRLLLTLYTPRRVAAALGLTQGMLCAGAIAGDGLGTEAISVFAIVAVAFGAVTIGVLDTARWRPARIAVGERRATAGRTARPAVDAR